MAVFSYKALNAQGKTVKGYVDADNIRVARQRLRQQGIFPTEITESRRRELTRSINLASLTSFRTQKISTNQLGILTRQLATLSGAGMPIVESLKALVEQIDQPGLKTVISEVSDRVNEGSTLAQAMGQYPNIFPRLYINLVASGESSGTLDQVLERLADLLENQATLRRKVLSALAYPVLMLILCFAVITLLLTFVVPQITEVFRERNAVLPLPTRIVIGLSNFAQSYWLLIILLIIGGGLLFRSYAKTDKGRKRIDSLLLKTPIIGPLKLKIASSRLARNLGMMLASGIEMLTALNIARNVIGSPVLEALVKDAQDGVREGRSLAKELNKSGVFPRLLIHMVAIGERTGQLEALLMRSANAYDSEVDSIISGLASILEPILIVFLAVIVGVILLAVMLPMLEMQSLMQG